MDDWFRLSKEESHFPILAENAYDRMAEFLVGSMAAQPDGFQAYPTASVLYNDMMMTLNYWSPSNTI